MTNERRDDESDYDDDARGYGRGPEKKGVSILKILGIGCLVMVLLLVAFGFYACEKTKDALAPELTNLLGKTEIAAGQLSHARAPELKTGLQAVKGLSENGDVKIVTMGMMVNNLQIVLANGRIDEEEVGILIDALEAIVQAKGDLSFEQIGEHTFEDQSGRSR